MNPSHTAPAYPDSAWHGRTMIRENVAVARDTYRVRFDCPEIARRILPGQFLMMRLAGCDDPLLGRPLAPYDVVLDGSGRPEGLDIVYLTVGKMTRRLAALEPGQALEIWGPLGNGFPPTQTEHLVIVAGGIGVTPFLMLAKEYLGGEQYGDPPRQVPRASCVTLCYGTRSADYLAGVEDFRRAGVQVQISTDDGSQGHCGPVVDLMRPVVEESDAACRIVCCGPEPMLEASAQLAQKLGLPCQVSLETPMACGIGICFSCAVKIREGQGRWDYRRTCVEGPVFDARDVVF